MENQHAQAPGQTGANSNPQSEGSQVGLEVIVQRLKTINDELVRALKDAIEDLEFHKSSHGICQIGADVEKYHAVLIKAENQVT